MHAIHSVFTTKAGGDSGKIIFLGLDPEKTYDIAWYYNPNVLIQPNTQDTHMVADEGTSSEFAVWRVSSIERELAKHNFYTLSKEEIEGILKETSTFDTRSEYSWRIVPT
jgi:hypothetical protein